MRNDYMPGYLAHSAKGTTWKKKSAKYISRVWKNGKWVYEYKITGKGYKKDAAQSLSRSKIAGEMAKKAKKRTDAYALAKAAKNYGTNSARELSNYYNKSLAGLIESGYKKITKLLDSASKITITDTFTGDTRTPKRTGKTVNIKELANKNSVKVSTSFVTTSKKRTKK